MKRFLLNLRFLKQCFTCHLILPTIFFHKNTRKYQRPSSRGRVYCCRVCRIKRILKDGVGVVLQDGKFVNKKFTKIELLKEFVQA